MTFTIVIFVIIAFLAILIGFFIASYNALVGIRNNVKKSWANIDVLLKQRHDELPKLIDACKEYMGYEQSTLQQVIAARNQVESARASENAKALGTAEDNLRTNLKSLFALAENYPDLKTNNSFIQLQTRVSDLENQIADRREFYNENVALNNTRIEQFPANIVAKMFDFQHHDLFDVSESDKTDVDIKTMFKQN